MAAAATAVPVDVAVTITMATAITVDIAGITTGTSRPARSEAPAAPAQPKVDSGSTALYGKIEIKK